MFVALPTTLTRQWKSTVYSGFETIAKPKKIKMYIRFYVRFVGFTCSYLHIIAHYTDLIQNPKHDKTPEISVFARIQGFYHFGYFYATETVGFDHPSVCNGFRVDIRFM